VPSHIGKPSGERTFPKNKNNLECLLGDVSEIKLKRTDTTLDLTIRMLGMEALEVLEKFKEDLRQKAKRAEEQNPMQKRENLYEI